MDALFNHDGIYGGLLSRIIAYSIDVALLFAVILVTQAILRPVNPLLGSTQPISGVRQHFWVFATVTLPVLLYFAFCISSSWQATIGMRLLKIKVTGLNEEAIGFGRAVLRSTVMLIPFELNHLVLFYPAPIWKDPKPGFRYGFLIVSALMILYLATVLLTEHHQSVHDLIASTVVRRVG